MRFCHVVEKLGSSPNTTKKSGKVEQMRVSDWKILRVNNR